MLFSEIDLQRRRPVWGAMAELFLDTELSDAEKDTIICTLAASPYSDEQLDFIYHAEVFPVLSPNLLVVAGVWSGFDTDWLEQQIIRRSPIRRPSRLAMWWRNWAYNGTLKEWRDIRQKLLAARSGVCENKP